MQLPQKVQPIKTENIDNGEQVDDKTQQRGKAIRMRSGENTLAYWRTRLFRNTYRDRDGRTVLIPEWYARFRHGGVTKRVRLKTADREQAAVAALALSQSVAKEGWVAVLDQQARLPASPEIDKLCETYAEIVPALPKPPKPISVLNYTRCLKQLCELAGVTQLRELTREAIDSKAREAYRGKARRAGRPESAITNSFAKILRNASAVFSKDALAAFERKGMKLETNPFLGVKKQQEIRRFKPLPQSVLDRIQQQAPKLLKGDPAAKDPAETPFAKAHKRAHGRTPKWRAIDFRKPHPDAYAALLLAYGCGMRAREIDHARWDWIKEMDGRLVLEIPTGEHAGEFISKSGEGRIIPLQQEVFDALKKTRSDLSPFIIGGQEPQRDSDAAKGLAYRSPSTFRAVNLWLRDMGVEQGSPRGHPLHTLRKQYGSHVATLHGLFHAQAILGHSDPKITSKYYASPTELPQVANFNVAG